VSFSTTDSRLNDDRLQQYNGRVGWSNDLGYVGAVESIAVDVIDNVWVTKIDSKANCCGIEWIINDNTDKLLDTDNAVSDYITMIVLLCTNSNRHRQQQLHNYRCQQLYVY